MQLIPGQVLVNRYRIVRLLGQGGFGAVYRVWDMQMEGVCAVKENLDTSAEAQVQFEKEAKMLFSLRHSGLPRVFDTFVVPGQGQYLVMDYIEGEDLQELLDRGAPLTVGQVINWISQVCDALTYLHSHQPAIIHRDIKPANIKITPENQAVLVDFGIAKVYDPLLMTTRGARAVTSGFSPPEQYGQGRTDAQSDVYALGATAYTLLTGQVPPESVEIMSGNEAAAPPVYTLNPAVPMGASKAIENAMQLNRSGRTQSAAAFKAALTAAPAPAPVQRAAVYTAAAVQAPAQPPISLPAAPRRSKGAIIWVEIGLVILSLVVLGWLAFRMVSNRDVVQRASTAMAELAANPLPGLLPTSNPAAQGQAPGSSANPAGPGTPQSPGQAGLPMRLTDDSGVEMALVPAGPFQMGDGWGNDDQLPVHTVALDDFYIDIYEVTNASYAACEQAGACTPPYSARSNRRESYYNDPQYARYPVVQVDWNQAIRYCAWRGARLPTEAEWEKAGRGGLEGKIYPWGDEGPVCERGASNGARFNDADQCNAVDTEEVGSYAANGYGLYDMAGNVWEWVSSLNKPYPYDPNDGREDLTASGKRLLRGGAWNLGGFRLCTACRDSYAPTNKAGYFGFRCAHAP